MGESNPDVERRTRVWEQLLLALRDPVWQVIGVAVAIILAVLGWTIFRPASSIEFNEGSDRPSVVQRILTSDTIPILDGWERSSDLTTTVLNDAQLVVPDLDQVRDVQGSTRCAPSGACDTMGAFLVSSDAIDQAKLNEIYSVSSQYGITKRGVYFTCVGHSVYLGETLCTGEVGSGLTLGLRWQPMAGAEEWPVATDALYAAQISQVLQQLTEALVTEEVSGTLIAEVDPVEFVNRGEPQRLILSVVGGVAASYLDVEVQDRRSDAGGFCSKIRDNDDCDLIYAGGTETDSSGRATLEIEWDPCAVAWSSTHSVLGSYSVWVKDRDSGLLDQVEFKVLSDSTTPASENWPCRAP